MQIKTERIMRGSGDGVLEGDPRLTDASEPVHSAPHGG